MWIRSQIKHALVKVNAVCAAGDDVEGYCYGDDGGSKLGDIHTHINLVASGARRPGVYEMPGE